MWLIVGIGGRGEGEGGEERGGGGEGRGREGLGSGILVFGIVSLTKKVEIGLFGSGRRLSKREGGEGQKRLCNG